MKPRVHTREDILAAYAVAAELVELHGEEFVPYFEFMEREVAELTRKEDALSRARRVRDTINSAGLDRRRVGNFLGHKMGNMQTN